MNVLAILYNHPQEGGVQQQPVSGGGGAGLRSKRLRDLHLEKGCPNIRLHTS